MMGLLALAAVLVPCVLGGLDMTRFRDTGHTLVTTKQTIRLTQTKAEGKSTYTLGLHPAYAVLEELLKNRQYLAFIEATEQPTNVTIEEPDLNAIVPNKGFVSLTAASEMPIVYPNGVANIISLISMMPEDEDKEKFLKASIIRALIDFHIKSHTKKVNDFALYVLRPHCTSGSLDPIMLPWVREFLRVTEPNTEQTLAWYLWYMNCPILGFDHRRELMLRVNVRFLQSMAVPKAAVKFALSPIAPVLQDFEYDSQFRHDLINILVQEGQRAALAVFLNVYLKVPSVKTTGGKPLLPPQRVVGDPVKKTPFMTPNEAAVKPFQGIMTVLGDNSIDFQMKLDILTLHKDIVCTELKTDQIDKLSRFFLMLSFLSNQRDAWQLRSKYIEFCHPTEPLKWAEIVARREPFYKLEEKVIVTPTPTGAGVKGASRKPGIGINLPGGALPKPGPSINLPGGALPKPGPSINLPEGGFPPIPGAREQPPPMTLPEGVVRATPPTPPPMRGAREQPPMTLPEGVVRATPPTPPPMRGAREQPPPMTLPEGVIRATPREPPPMRGGAQPSLRGRAQPTSVTTPVTTKKAAVTPSLPDPFAWINKIYEKLFAKPKLKRTWVLLTMRINNDVLFRDVIFPLRMHNGGSPKRVRDAFEAKASLSVSSAIVRIQTQWILKDTVQQSFHTRRIKTINTISGRGLYRDIRFPQIITGVGKDIVHNPGALSALLDRRALSETFRITRLDLTAMVKLSGRKVLLPSYRVPLLSFLKDRSHFNFDDIYLARESATVRKALTTDDKDLIETFDAPPKTVKKQLLHRAGVYFFREPRIEQMDLYLSVIEDQAKSMEPKGMEAATAAYLDVLDNNGFTRTPALGELVLRLSVIINTSKKPDGMVEALQHVCFGGKKMGRANPPTRCMNVPKHILNRYREEVLLQMELRRTKPSKSEEIEKNLKKVNDKYKAILDLFNNQVFSKFAVAFAPKELSTLQGAGFTDSRVVLGSFKFDYNKSIESLRLEEMRTIRASVFPWAGHEDYYSATNSDFVNSEILLHLSSKDRLMDLKHFFAKDLSRIFHYSDGFKYFLAKSVVTLAIDNGLSFRGRVQLKKWGTETLREFPHCDKFLPSETTAEETEPSTPERPEDKFARLREQDQRVLTGPVDPNLGKEEKFTCRENLITVYLRRAKFQMVRNVEMPNFTWPKPLTGGRIPPKPQLKPPMDGLLHEWIMEMFEMMLAEIPDSIDERSRMTPRTVRDNMASIFKILVRYMGFSVPDSQEILIYMISIIEKRIKG